MVDNTGVLEANGRKCDGQGSLLRQALAARATETTPSCVIDADLTLDWIFRDAEEFVRAIVDAEFGGVPALRMMLEAATPELNAAVRAVAQQDLTHTLDGRVMTVVVPPIVRALDDLPLEDRRLCVELDDEVADGKLIPCTEVECATVWLGNCKLIRTKRAAPISFSNLRIDRIRRHFVRLHSFDC